MNERELRIRYEIDDYSWKQFQDLSDEGQTAVLLELERLSPFFETHPERWGPCLSLLSRGFRIAERHLEKRIESLLAWTVSE